MLQSFRTASAWRPGCYGLAGTLLGSLRGTGNAVRRRRRRALAQAEADPKSHPAKIRKLREIAAQPTFDLLRHIAENKIGKAVSEVDRKNLWYDLQYKRYAPVFMGQFKPRMQLWTAALEESQLPLARLPEVAVAGRSNSGKSTLINYLCGRNSAKVKRMPGSTTEIVFWQIGRPAQLCLVDLPGYGFANAPEEKRLQWTEFTLWYVRARKNLKRVLLLIDARQGIKASDKEMIAYLERHNVSWQVVVTKCDQVKSKDLAKRITILQEDLNSYTRMAGQPIPVSALKRHGMELLRSTLDGMKVMKEVVKEGIRMRVYDLLEARRIKNGERLRKKKETKRLKEQEAQEVQESKALADLPSDATIAPGTDLHSVLNDWAHIPQRQSGAEEATASAGPKPLVVEVHYDLEDRDSLRVASLMQSLFPGLQPPSEAWAEASPPVRWAHSIDEEFSELFPGTVFHEESDSEDDVVLMPMPQVLRFDPTPSHAGSKPSRAAHASGAGGKSPFPGMAASESSQSEKVDLRRDRFRPKGDQIMDQDDFASPEDRASAFRRFSPPAPGEGRPGVLMAMARRRYEREWAMELESVDKVRSNTSDVGPAPLSVSSAAKQGRDKMHAKPRPYITQIGNKPIPSGRGMWRVLGRPPARILKKLKDKDVGKVFNLKNLKNDVRKKRRFGSGLEWEDAQEKWMSWYETNKKNNFDRVEQAESPKLEDVEANYAERLRRRFGKGNGKGSGRGKGDGKGQGRGTSPDTPGFRDGGPEAHWPPGGA